MALFTGSVTSVMTTTAGLTDGTDGQTVGYAFIIPCQTKFWREFIFAVFSGGYLAKSQQ